MLVDSFDYIACYKGLHPNLDTAIDWLNSHTLDALENGRTIIDGEKVFVNVMDADLRDAEGAAFEYHLPPGGGRGARLWTPPAATLTCRSTFPAASIGAGHPRAGPRASSAPRAMWALRPARSMRAASWEKGGLSSSSPVSCTSPAAKRPAVTM